MLLYQSVSHLFLVSLWLQDELTSSLLRDWTQPQDVRTARQRLAEASTSGGWVEFVQR